MEKINIVWLKKDIRSQDHAALKAAELSQYTTLVLFIFEPIVENNYDFDIRHWQFIYHSLKDLEIKMPINIIKSDCELAFKEIQKKFQIINVFSHQETGNKETFQRDKQMKRFFKSQQINWIEFQTNAVIRGKHDRNGWDQLWLKTMKEKLIINEISKMKFIKLDHLSLPQTLMNQLSEQDWSAGEINAHEMLKDFLEFKIENYFSSLSYPEKSKYFTSHLSSYLTYGNLSIRQVYQATLNRRIEYLNKKSIDQFLNRLKWHCHFIQKFESQPAIEFENLNAAFDDIRQKKNKKFIKAWRDGQTGYPLIDAAMRCVRETGHLNFRLRATVVSFLTHHLFQPWQEGARILARYFIDYEPGIHFSQFQMQAGTMGIHTLRIYNPVKQSLEKDKDAMFIKTWVPELANLPVEFIHQPWLMNEMEQMLYQFKLGENYPKRIVDHEKAAEMAREKLWETKNSNKSKKNALVILKRHVRAKRKSYASNN